MLDPLPFLSIPTPTTNPTLPPLPTPPLSYADLSLLFFFE